MTDIHRTVVIDAMRKGHGDPFIAANAAYDAGQNDGYMNGQRDALDAAREAVLAAIDALRKP